jgi:hypothetical protein
MEHGPLFGNKDRVELELHPETMNGIAVRNVKSLPGFQTLVPQQADNPAPRGGGHPSTRGEDGVSGAVMNLEKI